MNWAKKHFFDKVLPLIISLSIFIPRLNDFLWEHIFSIFFSNFFGDTLPGDGLGKIKLWVIISFLQIFFIGAFRLFLVTDQIKNKTTIAVTKIIIPFH